jgi:hypothetical protein
MDMVDASGHPLLSIRAQNLLPDYRCSLQPAMQRIKFALPNFRRDRGIAANAFS